MVLKKVGKKQPFLCSLLDKHCNQDLFICEKSAIVNATDCKFVLK